MIAVAVREIVETDYSGEHSVKRVETVAVHVTFPEGCDPNKKPDYCIVGDWRLEFPKEVK